MPTEAPQALVRYESQDGVATITISRPSKKNAINAALADDLEAAWLRFDQGEDRVAVVVGFGDTFSAGADIKDPPLRGYGFIPNVGVPTDKPIIAAVEGWCIGAALIMVQHADLCVASDSARFGYPEPRMGLSRGLISGLASRLAHKHAIEIMLLGEDISSAEMHRMGLVNKVVQNGESLATAQTWADKIGSFDSGLVQFLKRGVGSVVPKSPGEISEHTKWEANQLPGNIRVAEGDLEAFNASDGR